MSLGLPLFFLLLFCVRFIPPCTSVTSSCRGGKDWAHTKNGGPKFYTPPPTPENSWRVAFQGLFFFLHPALCFPIFQAFFLRGFLSRKNPRVFWKATGSAELRASENQIVHATLVFQWSSKSLIIPILKHMSENGQKRSPVKTCEIFWMSRNAL